MVVQRAPKHGFLWQESCHLRRGDSAGYGDNYCDAVGELYDCFTGKGAKVYGMTPSDSGFDYSESKSVSDGKFVGAVFDEDNYGDESEERANAWVEQLKSEGFM